MNYLKHYIKLIRNAQIRKTINGYKERHHIFPKSIFGENDCAVELTAKEHFIAHLLLYKGFNKRYGLNHIRTQKMLYTLTLMGGNKKININSTLYEKLKLKWSKEQSNKMKELQKDKKNHLRYGRKNSKYHKEALLKANTGKKYIIKNDVVKKVPKEEVEKYLKDGWKLGTRKFSKEHKEKMSKASKGKKHSKETKKKLSEITKKQMTLEAKKHLSEINKGKNNPNYGTIWINNGIENKKIKKNELDKYPTYNKGRINNRKWINKENNRKYVNKLELEKYLKDGWKLGMK